MAASFHAIHQNATTWANRPAALFKAAECYEELSRRSFAISDARKAAGIFEEVARQHESSRLADDALLRAARIRADRLKDTRGALKLLDTLCRDYPRGDMYAEARRLRQELAPGKDAPQPSVQPARQISDTPPADDARQALQRYENAKKTMELLRADKRRSCWREEPSQCHGQRGGPVPCRSQRPFPGRLFPPCRRLPHGPYPAAACAGRIPRQRPG